MDPQKSDLLQGTLDVLILKIVALGPIHGYGIAQRIRQISKAVLQVQQGSLYPAFTGWRNGAGCAPSGARGRPGAKRSLSLTKMGRKQLEAETANWDRLSEAVTMILRTAQ